MVLLRSGAVLFISVTVVATLILSLLFFGNAWREGWSPGYFYVIWFAQAISLVTLPTCVLLVAAVRAGRRRPGLDGVLLIAGVGGAWSGVYLAMIHSNPMSRGYELFAGLYYAAGLVTIIPAYLITYFALRHTPLLRDLAPPRKSKGPAAASP